jgi:alpha-beta hydrolase superfamily lysophospholipase
MAEKHLTHLPAVVWIPQGKPKAVLQILHGMTEHMEQLEIQ